MVGSGLCLTASLIYVFLLFLAFGTFAASTCLTTSVALEASVHLKAEKSRLAMPSKAQSRGSDFSGVKKVSQAVKAKSLQRPQSYFSRIAFVLTSCSPRNLQWGLGRPPPFPALTASAHLGGCISRCKSVVLNCGEILAASLQRAFGNAWKHFSLSQLEEGPPVGRGQEGCSKPHNAQMPRTPSSHPQQRMIQSKNVNTCCKG